MNKILKRIIYILVTICYTTAGWSQNEYYKNQPIELNFEGPSSSEKASDNPFLFYRLQVTFTQNDKNFEVPGFFAADGNAADSGAENGSTWRVIFTPNSSGLWYYKVSFRSGHHISVDDDIYVGNAIKPLDGKSGSFQVQDIPQDATGFDKSGRIQYNNSRYFHTEDGQPFLKFGANSPENFLAFEDIDGTYSYDAEKIFLKSYEPHYSDWKTGDPTWKNGKGKGIMGALNYLASMKMNTVYALTLNIEGDARDVWPYIGHRRQDFTRFDVSKLAQWEIIFSHAESLGIIMHLITQEKENELILDDGDTGKLRKLYYRELIARFGHHKNIIWNMGEENGMAPFWRQGQSHQQRFAMIRYVKDHDPYKNPVVIHTMSESEERDENSIPLLGFDRLDGLSMQVSHVHDIHSVFIDWMERSNKANRPFILSMDEIGPWHTGTRPDVEDPKHDTLRQEVLWGTLMAGGAGVEWYFGWHNPPNDLNAEDWRSREQMWIQTDIAHQFFKSLPYTEMVPADHLITQGNNHCFAKEGDLYVIYLEKGGTANLALEGHNGEFRIKWYNPRMGGDLMDGSVKKIEGGSNVAVGLPPNDIHLDWAILITKM